MSWQEREISWQEQKGNIQEAQSVLRKRQGKIGTKGARFHHETLENRAIKLMILKKGICRTCQRLIIEIFERGVYKEVGLGCEFKKSPLGLHRPFWLKEGLPECPSFVLFEQEEESLIV